MTCPLGMLNPNCARICSHGKRCTEEGSKQWLASKVKVHPPRKRKYVFDSERRAVLGISREETISKPSFEEVAEIPLSESEKAILRNLEEIGEDLWIMKRL